MLLTILTPSMRHDNLPTVQRSIQQALSHTTGALTVRHLVQYNPAERLPYPDHMTRWNAVMTSVRSGWICWLSDDNAMHPMFLHRLEQVLLARPDARAIIFAQERYDAIGNLAATPDNIRPYHIDGGQCVVHTSIIGRHRWSDRETGDAELLAALYAKHAETFVFVNELLTSHDRLTWPAHRTMPMSTERLLAVVPVHHRSLHAAATRRALELPCAVEWLELENDPDEPASYGAILRKYQHARDVLLAGDYTAMLCVEDDMLLPPDGLAKLLAVESDIVYSAYCCRHRSHHWNCYTAIDEWGGVPITQYEASRHIGSPVQCVGAGQGFTLIRRPVLESFPFRVPDGHPYAPDWWLALDAKHHHFRQHCHTGVQCGHLLSPTHAVWPDVSSPYMHRIRPL